MNPLLFSKIGRVASKNSGLADDSLSYNEEIIEKIRTNNQLYRSSSLAWKIIFITFITVLVFTIYIAITLINSNSQASLLEEIRSSRYPVNTKLEEAFFILRVTHKTLRDAVITNDKDTLDEAVYLKNKFEDVLDEVVKIDETKLSSVKKINKKFNRYFNNGYTLADSLIRSSPMDENLLVDGKKNQKLYEGVINLLNDFKGKEVESFNQSINKVTMREKKIVNFGTPIAVLTVVVIFLCAYYISRKIIYRLNAMVDTLRAIASDNGDMSARIEVKGQDEMTELSFWFNKFIDKLEKSNYDSTKEIRRLAYIDALTNLPNRRLFNSYLKTTIERFEKNNQSLAVMFLDLDNFKSVNDQMGHDKGDLLIREVARRLKKTVRAHDVVALDKNKELQNKNLVARMGGDEFMIIIPQIKNIADLTFIAERLRKSVLAPLTISGSKIEVGVSIGISIFPNDGLTTEELVINADLAMYEAKKNGKNNYCFFNKNLGDGAKHSTDIINALKNVLNNESCGDLDISFQPKFDINHLQMVGAEALIRWDDTFLGSIPPEKFIPLAENNDLICQIDAWVIKTVCQKVSRWMQAGYQMVPISINVSAKQAARSDLVTIVGRVIKAENIPPHLVELEITETSALSSVEVVAENIRLLKNMGISVAVDDFGAGHASLSLFKLCEIDTLKIDREFISELSDLDNKHTIIEGIIALAKVLNVKTVAEGVEQQIELDTLKRMGCDFVQGYLLAKPMTAEGFAEMIKNQVNLYG